MVHGYGGPYVGNVPNNTRLNIPPQNLEDGPQGVADGVTQVTCWPSALTVVMSWNETAMYAFGDGMGQEQKIKGTTVMLGPGVNLARVPWGGRNFEYQGEDPVLAGRMVAAEVKGIQDNQVSGCVKHYVENNQEYDRSGVSANVQRRAHMELFMQPFVSA
jgi:beta-glucosidase